MERRIDIQNETTEKRSFLLRVADRATNSPSLVSWLILVVGALDMVLTIRALDLGWLIELNPIADWVIRHYGRNGLAVFRFIGATGTALILYWALIQHRSEQIAMTTREHVQSVVGMGVVVIVATHVTLVLWWAAWMTV